MKHTSPKRHSRKSYLNDFHQTPSGAYAYKGALYSYIPKNKSLKQALVQLWALYGSTLIAAIIAGCLPVYGMRSSIYVILPYTALLICTIRLCWALGRLTAGGNPLREYIYLACLPKFPVWTTLAIICTACLLLGELTHLILYRTETHAILWFFFTLIYILFAAFWSKRLIRQMQWSK